MPDADELRVIHRTYCEAYSESAISGAVFAGIALIAMGIVDDYYWSTFAAGVFMASAARTIGALIGLGKYTQ